MPLPSTPDPQAHPSAKNACLVLVWAACLVVVWPGVFSTEALGHPTSDMPDHLWGSWWFGGELLSGRLPLVTEATHLPAGGRLWYADPLGAILALPFRFLGYPRAYNITLALQLLFAGTAGFLLGWTATRRHAPAIACGVLCGASPYAISLVHSGLSEYLGLAWPILFTRAWLQCLEGRARVRSAVFWLWVCTLQAFYYALFGLLLAACFLPGPDWRTRLRPLVKLALAWAVTALPLLAAFWWTLAGESPVLRPESAPGWSQVSLPATDLLSWLHPGAWYHPDTPALGNPGILHVNYLGWTALCLAGLGCFATEARAHLRGSGLFALFSLGPALSINRLPLRIAGFPLFLPLALLYVPGSPFRSVHHPYRMVAFLIPLLAILVAHGLARLPRPVQWLAPLVILAETLWCSPAPWPVVTTPISSAVTEDLAGEGAILDWPPDATHANRGYLLAQVVHGRGIAYGLNTFLPEALQADALVSPLLALLENPQARTTNRDIPGPPLNRRVTEGPSQLESWGFEWLVVHTEHLSLVEEQAIQVFLRENLGAPEGSEGVLVWRIGDSR